MSDPREPADDPHEILGLKLPRRVCPATLAVTFALLLGILTGLFAYTHLGAIVGSGGRRKSPDEPPAIAAPGTPYLQAPEAPEP